MKESTEHQLPEADVITLDNGRLLLSKRWQPIFADNKLDSFELLASHPGHSIAKKVLSFRYTLKIHLVDKRGTRETFFIKRYLPSPDFMSPEEQAAAEWKAMWLFRKEKLPGPEPVALGSDHKIAFVISKEVPHVMNLEEWATKNIANSSHKDQIIRRGKSLTEIITEVIQEVAKITGRMHRAGMCHQDLYLCHFLCATRERPLPLHLIDLQRVKKFPKRLPLDRQIKDLAQLLYSASPFITKNGIRSFWNIYKAICPQPPLAALFLLPLIRFKAARIERHTKRHRL